MAPPVGDARALSLERAALLRGPPPPSLAAALSHRPRKTPPLGGDDAVLGVQLSPGRILPPRERDAARAAPASVQSACAAGTHDHEPRAQRVRPPATRARAAR